jgi:hypothetical protein
MRRLNFKFHTPYEKFSMDCALKWASTVHGISMWVLNPAQFWANNCSTQFPPKSWGKLEAFGVQLDGVDCGGEMWLKMWVEEITPHPPQSPILRESDLMSHKWAQLAMKMSTGCTILKEVFPVCLMFDSGRRKRRSGQHSKGDERDQYKDLHSLQETDEWEGLHQYSICGGWVQFLCKWPGINDLLKYDNSSNTFKTVSSTLL